MKKKILIAFLMISGVVETICAQQPAIMLSDKKGWHKIGETTVSFTKEKDEIIVMGADRFASIRFEVTDAPVDLQSLEIFYESGPSQNMQVHDLLMVGHESKAIDLNGGERALKKIIFVYKTLYNRKDEKAHVIVWGFKTNADKANTDDVNPGDVKSHDGEIAKPELMVSDKPGWHKIGETHVDFKKDRDELKVLGKDRFKQIKLKAEEASIGFIDVEVYYENETVPQQLHLGVILKPGEETKTMELEGRNKAIDKIVLIYKTVPNREKERGEVVVYGLK